MPQKDIEKIRYDRWKLRLKHFFNITPEQYNEIFKKQNGKCAICERHRSEFKNNLCVDCNSETKIVRGLLCSKCLRGLSLFSDKIELLDNARTYLIKT